MIGAICAATTGAYAIRHHNVVNGGSQGTGGRTLSKHTLTIKPSTNVNPQSLGVTSQSNGPAERMPTNKRELIFAHAASANPFYAKQALLKDREEW